MSDLERRSRVNRCIQGPLEYFDGAFRKDSKWFLALKYVGKKSPHSCFAESIGRLQILISKVNESDALVDTDDVFITHLKF